LFLKKAGVVAHGYRDAVVRIAGVRRGGKQFVTARRCEGEYAVNSRQRFEAAVIVLTPKPDFLRLGGAKRI
jgi:hypothetical protein